MGAFRTLMSSSSFAIVLKLQRCGCRNFITSLRKTTDKTSNKETSSGTDTGTAGRFHVPYKPSNMEKRMLVWTKKYPNIEAVPKYVPQNEMERAKNKVRIYTNVGMIVLTIFASMFMIHLGKKAAEEGESVTKMNLEWHKKMNEATSNEK